MASVRYLAIALLLAGCAAKAPPAPPLRLPPPAAAQAAPYRLQVGDVVGIRLFLTPELNEDVTVRPDGRVTTQLAEAIPAAGRTPEQLAASLRTAYLTELKDPQITVELKSFAPLRVYLAGEVPSPGEITSAGPPPTLLEAIAKAGGIRVTGDASHILIIRRGDDDKPQVFAADYQAAASGRDPAADIRLQAFDIVVVPRTDIAEIYVWVNQHIQQFVPVSWGFSYNVTPVVSNKK
jgi:protein involved in polysaccharide export with SLBB domain